MLIAGIGIPIMAALNSGLGEKIDSPVFAGFLLFLLALAVTGLIAMLNPVPSIDTLFRVSPQFYLGGLFVAFYVLTITWIAPKIGVGNAVFLVLFGQIFAAALIDNFGLFGSPRWPITPLRSLGLVLMAVGVYLARRPASE